MSKENIMFAYRLVSFRELKQKKKSAFKWNFVWKAGKSSFKMYESYDLV